MKLNTMNVVLAMLMANQEKKRLQDKGYDVPKNFGLVPALLAGTTKQPYLASLLLQNEVQKRDEVISPVAEKQLEAYNEALKAIVNELISIKVDINGTSAPTDITGFKSLLNANLFKVIDALEVIEQPPTQSLPDILKNLPKRGNKVLVK